MATINKSDLAVFSELSIVRVDGFEPEKTWIMGDDGVEYDATPPVELPGTPNWLANEYGMQVNDLDPQEPGIIWTDLGGHEWEFSVLIASDEVEDFKKLAAEHGYEIRGIDPVAEPMCYGDSGGGVATIMKHPDGWVVVS